MPTITHLPARHFPLHQELLGRTTENGMVGDVARALTEPGVSHVELTWDAVHKANRLFAGVPAKLMPLLAAMRPLGPLWLEFPASNLRRCGLLCSIGPEGTVSVRRVDGGSFRAARCLFMPVHRRGPAAPFQIDWTAVLGGNLPDDAGTRDCWADWAAHNLGWNPLHSSQDAAAYPAPEVANGVLDLLMVSYAISPVVLKDAWVFKRMVGY